MFKASGNTQIDRLNAIALDLAKNQKSSFDVLSTGEKCYVALASNRLDLLDSIGYTIAEALARLGEEWTNALIASWRYAGNPAKYD